jgi:hypothetical protein
VQTARGIQSFLYKNISLAQNKKSNNKFGYKLLSRGSLFMAQSAQWQRVDCSIYSATKREKSELLISALHQSPWDKKSESLFSFLLITKVQKSEKSTKE